MDIRHLVNITSRAWSLSILASLNDGVPGRQAPLLAATGASRTAFSQSVSHLMDIGLLERNPGHGHPLRPEYRLTSSGTQAAEMAGKIRRADPDGDDHALLRRVWTVPVLAVCEQPRFFGDIKNNLAPVTDRALSQTLKQLSARNWIHRHIDLSLHPPRPEYQAVNAGFEIAEAANTLRA